MTSHRNPSKRRNSVDCLMYLILLGSMSLPAQVTAAPSQTALPLLSNPPEARSPIVLTAINHPHTGKGVFSFDRREDPPVIRANPGEDISIGDFHHWRVTNGTHEVHPFHIHQVHFLIYARNGVRLEHPEWLDTVNVPLKGMVDLMMDFTDPIIRAVSLFHCHLLSHEDKGMMAKILFK